MSKFTLADVPKYTELMWPTLQVLQDKKGSASNSEIIDAVIEKMRLPDSVRDVTHDTGLPVFKDRLNWARSWLKNAMNAVDNVNPGVWALTQKGVDLLKGTEDALHKEFMSLKKAYLKAWSDKNKHKQSTASKEGTGAEEQEGGDWKTALLDRLLTIDSYKFEHLCGSLLRKEGFTDVKVTNRSRDGGIDGTASWRIGLLSFDVVFQCKRYKGTVGSKDMDGFLGALMKLGAKRGLFITTGSYTKAAEQTALNSPAYKVDLIDGDTLCDLLKNREMGVKTQEVIDEAFFVDLEKKP